MKKSQGKLHQVRTKVHHLRKKIHHFLGKDLPKRELPLNFSFPDLTGKVKGTIETDEDLALELEEVKGIPQKYFGLLIDSLKYINRAKMKPRDRLIMAKEIMKLYYPVAIEQLVKLAKSRGIPEADYHKETLDLIIEIAQTMIICYQILFSDYYHGTNFRYARGRQNVWESASRILELLVLKQHAKSMRYQVMDEEDWRIANTIFYVMSCYEDVEQPLSTLNKELRVGGRRRSTCLRDQYALLHTVAKFDMLRWPTHLHWVIGSYFHSIENAVQVKPDQGDPKLGRYELITYGFDASPARNHRLNSPPGTAFVLSFNGLAEAIRKDCLGLLQAKKNNDETSIPTRFSQLPETAHFVISEQLVRGLGNAPNEKIEEKEHKIGELRIFVGFQDVFGLLEHKIGHEGTRERLVDILAKHSALLADDQHSNKKSIWSLLFKNDKMIRLSTQETVCTTEMDIGSLLAYGVGDGIDRPNFGVVSRIFRPEQQLVIVDIHTIATYAEPVMIALNTSQQTSTNKANPALLVYDKLRLGGWGLMCQPMNALLGVDHVAMFRKNQGFKVNLKNMCNATDDFYLFATSLTSQHLDMDDPKPNPHNF
jgi:hypothetical protein